MAHRLLDLASAVADSQVDGKAVPPQSRATRTALAEMASAVATAAAHTAADSLKARTGATNEGSVCESGVTAPGFSSPATGPDSDPSITFGELLASSLVDAHLHLHTGAAVSVSPISSDSGLKPHFRSIGLHTSSLPTTSTPLVSSTSTFEPTVTRGTSPQTL